MISAAPSREGGITLRDGRRLSYAEFGDLAGLPVVLLHGNPGSRLICPDVATTANAGVRLITFDRPGFGGSDPRPFHHLGDVAADLAELATAIGVTTCAIIGWSGGGPYAQAAAIAEPDLVTSVALVSGSGLQDDPDVLAQYTDEVSLLLARLRNHDPVAGADIEERFAFYAADPSVIVTMTLDNQDDPDRRLMQQPAVRDALTTMWQEGARQGVLGLAAGWMALWALPRGFAPAAIRQPVTVWHGSADVIVPFAQAERVAAAIPHARLHILPGEGHLTAIEHWGEILDSL